MVTKLQASLIPFNIKKDQRGRILRIAATGHRGGEIRGSIQKTNDNLDYIEAGVGVQIISSSNGQVRINFDPDVAPAPATATYVVMSADATLSVERVLTAGSGISIVDAGAGSTVTIATTGAPPTGPAGGDLGSTYPNPTVTDLTITSEQQGSIVYFNGSNWVQLTPGSTGQFLQTQGAGANPQWQTSATKEFDDQAAYLVLSTTASLDNERVLSPGFGLNFADAGAGGNYSIQVDKTVFATVSGTHFAGNITATGTGSFESGISGSLTRLVDGTSYIAAGDNVTVVSQSNGQVTISVLSSGAPGADPGASYVVIGLTGSLINERALAASTGINLVDGGANGSATLSIDDSIVATVSGTRFKGSIQTTGTGTFDFGISGSLTRLVDGSSYIIAGDNITVASASNGAVTISAVASAVSAKDSISIVPDPSEVSGTTETLVGSVYLNQITFENIRALLGSTGAGDTATLRVRRNTTSAIIAELSTLGALADAVTTGSSVPIPATGWYDAYLVNSSASGSALCNGIKFIGADLPRELEINVVTQNAASGTSEVLVGSVYLRSGTMDSAIAMLGAQSADDTATLRVRRFGTAPNIIELIALGTLQNQVTTGSVIVPVTDWYDIFLSNSSVSGSALVGGIKFVGVPIATGSAGTSRFAYPLLFPVTGTYQVPSGHQRVPYSGSAIVISASLSPTTGDQFGVKNMSSGTSPVTIVGNGSLIEDPSTGFSLTSSFELAGDGISVIWEYTGAEWIVI